MVVSSTYHPGAVNLRGSIPRGEEIPELLASSLSNGHVLPVCALVVRDLKHGVSCQTFLNFIGSFQPTPQPHRLWRGLRPVVLSQPR